MSRGTVLVTGAGGFLGSRLVPLLLAHGWSVRASFTDIARSREMPWRGDVECIELDVTNPHQLRYAVRHVDAVVYLVHSMAGPDFAARDRLAAALTARAVDEAGVGRVVYVSGLVPRGIQGRDMPDAHGVARGGWGRSGGGSLSEHLASRLEVETRLSASAATVVTLRAAVVVGAGSTSFEVIEQIARRLPVHAIPTWMATSRVQPVAVEVLLLCIAGALRVPTATRSYDVGGPDRLTYRRLLARYCRLAGLVRPQVFVPMLPSDLVGRLAGVITDVPTPTVRALVESLRHDMVCRDDTFRELLPAGHELIGIDDAIRAALTS